MDGHLASYGKIRNVAERRAVLVEQIVHSDAGFAQPVAEELHSQQYVADKPLLEERIGNSAVVVVVGIGPDDQPVALGLTGININRKGLK